MPKSAAFSSKESRIQKAAGLHAVANNSRQGRGRQENPLTPKLSRSTQLPSAQNREFPAYKATHGWFQISTQLKNTINKATLILCWIWMHVVQTTLRHLVLCSAKRSPGKEASRIFCTKWPRICANLRNPCGSIFLFAVEMFLFHSFLRVHHVSHRSVCCNHLHSKTWGLTTELPQREPFQALIKWVYRATHRVAQIIASKSLVALPVLEAQAVASVLSFGCLPTFCGSCKSAFGHG